MPDYSGKQATAARLIQSKGEMVTVRTFNSTPNPAEPWKPSEADPPYTDQTAPAFPTPVSAGAPTIRYSDGSESKAGDLQFLFAGTALPSGLRLGSLILRPNGEKWTVKAVQKIDPDSQPILLTAWAVQ